MGGGKINQISYRSFEEKGYKYEKDDLGNLYVTKGVSDYYPLVLTHTDSVHDIEEMIVKEEYLPNSQGESNCSWLLTQKKMVHLQV